MATQTGAIALVPLGPVPGDLLDWLSSKLQEVLDAQVVTGKEIPLPQEAYKPGRQQYEGDALLARLRRVPFPGARRLVGLADADCYADGLNFIFGQATVGGREAFVALARLRQSFYGLSEDQALFRERVLKEVVHELGHTWGLAHCPDPKCVMHFSNRLEDTDVKGLEFCPHCQAKMTG